MLLTDSYWKYLVKIFTKSNNSWSNISDDNGDSSLQRSYERVYDHDLATANEILKKSENGLITLVETLMNRKQRNALLRLVEKSPSNFYLKELVERDKSIRLLLRKIKMLIRSANNERSSEKKLEKAEDSISLIKDIEWIATYLYEDLVDLGIMDEYDSSVYPVMESLLQDKE